MWFKKRVPVYTLTGQSIYNSLCVEPLAWRVEGYYIANKDDTIRVYNKYGSSWAGRVRFDKGHRNCYPDIISYDDVTRIIEKSEEVKQLIVETAKQDNIQATIIKLNPEFHSEFDDDLRSLAKSILKNNKDSAKLFLIICQNHMQKVQKVVDSINKKD
jgi:hypothetical protein